MNPTPQASSKRVLALTLAAALLGWMFDGLEQGLFPLVARPSLMELMGPDAATSMGTWLSGIMAAFLVGAALGGVFFGWLGDRIGRVRAMVLSIATYAVFSGLCGLVQTPLQLAVLRFLAALGMGGEWALGVALVMEIWPSRFRPMLAGSIGAAANVGFLLTGLMGLGLAQVIGDLGGLFRSCGMPQSWIDPLLANSGWRLLLFLGATPALLALLIQAFVPESERWKHAAASGPKNRLGDIFRGGLHVPVLKGMLLAAIALLGTWGSVLWIPAWADKLSGQAPEAKAYAQIVLAIGAILGCTVGPRFAQWTSRRFGYFTLCLGSLIVCEYMFHANLTYGWFFLVVTGVAGGLTASFYGWLPLYLPELYPTRLRATAQGFAYNAGRILSAAGVLGSGYLLNLFHEDYAQAGAITCLIYVAGMIFIWFCPETKGRPLPE